MNPVNVYNFLLIKFDLKSFNIINVWDINMKLFKIQINKILGFVDSTKIDNSVWK